MTNQPLLADVLGLTASQAALHYQAMTVAAAALRDQRRLKAAQNYLPVINGQLAQYEAELARMAEHFPSLVP